MNYQKLYNAFKKYNEYNSQKFYNKVNNDFKDALIAAYNLTFGKKIRKFNEKLILQLGDETIAKIRVPFESVVKENFEKHKSIKSNMENMLKEYAKNYVVNPSKEMHCLESVDSGRYHTQGFGANKYAKESLSEDKLLLDLYGFKTEIREIYDDFTDKWGIRYMRYELWGNITEFDYWMFKNNHHFISVLNWAVLCWRKNTNPKVYFPFLSDKDYEYSQQLAYHSNYQITKDNCMLEDYNYLDNNK